MLKREQFSGSDRLQVAIAGFDVEGQATYQYLKARGDVDLTIIDERQVALPSGVEARLGPGVFEAELDFDQIWRTPGLALKKIKTSGQIWSATREFFAKCPAPIIGVTGSKGKGTTATLIAKILEASGRTVHLVGNIGQPALAELDKIAPQDVAVYELSSFQLWDLDKSPHIAVVLMIEPDHLDVHQDLADYLQAKQNITRWQVPGDFVVHHPTNPHSLAIAKVGLGEKQAFLTTAGANIRGSDLVIDEQKICAVSDFGLLGPHNHENIAAAVTASWHFQPQPQAAAQAIKQFKGLEHRLQLVHSAGGVDFIDDSIATTPSAAIAAINSFDQPKILILGGSDKGADFSQLAEVVANKNVKTVVLIGLMADRLESALDAAGFKSTRRAKSMAEAVAQAKQATQAGDVVILSPGCASFDMFDNYKDRGRQFITAAKQGD